MNKNYDPRLWQQARKRTGFKIHFTVYVLVNIFLWISWYFIGRHAGQPGPALTTLGWGVGVLFHYLHTYRKLVLFDADKEYQKLEQKQNL